MLVDKERTVFKCWYADDLVLFDVILHYTRLGNKPLIHCSLFTSKYYKPQAGKFPFIYINQAGCSGVRVQRFVISLWERLEQLLF